ncbi:MAG TPA: hypothetical protein VD970_18185 [Acetobacteraceae bacterium]|nr:hypothetical protein [Acetobacteraceae bacterium]
MRRSVLFLLALLASAAPSRAEEPGGGLCAARFSAADGLALEHRFTALLLANGCQPGDLLHLVFEGSHATAAAARHCRFDRPVLLDRGAETHLVCVWQGVERRPRG